MPTSAHSCQSATVAGSTPSAALTTNNAASAARSPARNSPTKSAYPGVSIRLILTSSDMIGATARPTERCWWMAAGSWSQTVVPSTTEPARGSTPVAASKDSVRVVLPEPEGPTSAMLRTLAGSSTATAAPFWPVAGPLSTCLVLMIHLLRTTPSPDEDHAVRRCRTLFVYLDQTPVLGFVTSPRTAGQRQAHSGSLASVDGPGSGPRSGLLRTGRIGCTERSTCAVRWMVTHPEVRFPRGFRFADIRCN